MSDLTEFLLARIDDDLMDVGSLECPCDLSHDGTHAAFCPVRVLADVAAKRRIVEKALLYADAQYPDYDGGYASASEDAVALLATVHADHPDYREEWRP